MKSLSHSCISIHIENIPYGELDSDFSIKDLSIRNLKINMSSDPLTAQIVKDKDLVTKLFNIYNYLESPVNITSRPHSTDIKKLYNNGKRNFFMIKNMIENRLELIFSYEFNKTCLTDLNFPGLLNFKDEFGDSIKYFSSGYFNTNLKLFNKIIELDSQYKDVITPSYRFYIEGDDFNFSQKFEKSLLIDFFQNCK